MLRTTLKQAMKTEARFEALSWEDYNAIDGVRYSTLKRILISPKHYQHAISEPFEPSGAMQVGTAVHTKILQPGIYEDTVVVFDEGASRNSAAYTRYKAKNDGKTILLEKEQEVVEAMAEAVKRNTFANDLVKACEPELAMIWDAECKGELDEVIGVVPCKGRLDGLIRAHGDARDIIIGIKTSRDIAPDAFGRAAVNYDYTLQWGMYYSGCCAILQPHEDRLPIMYEIVIENKPPHDVVVCEITPAVIGNCLEVFNDALRLYCRCQSSGQWPGCDMGNQSVGIMLPRWAFDIGNDDVNIDFGGEEGWSDG